MTPAEVLFVDTNVLIYATDTVSPGKQVHDATIVATMQVRGISRLETHNTADFARSAGLITVVPLV